MIAISSIFNNIFCGINFLATKNADDPVLWYFFLIFLVIIGIISGVLVFLYSKSPENWEHTPIIDEYYAPGKLRYFADSVKMMPIDYSDASPMKEYIQIIFFEKIREIYGISTRELFELKTKNPKKLSEIIKDKEIVDFILNFQKKEEKTGFFDGFKQNKVDQRKKYFREINSILEKMEVWGE